MVTLKEYEIYLKVKKFIKTEGCDEADINSRGWLTESELFLLTFH